MFISFLYRYLLIGLFDHFEFQVFNLKKIFCSFTGIFIWHGCSKFRDKKMKSIISISSSQALCLSRVPSFCLSVCRYESIVFCLFLLLSHQKLVKWKKDKWIRQWRNNFPQEEWCVILIIKKSKKTFCE